MAADYNKPVTTDNYADILTQLRDNIAAAQTMLNDLTGVTNIPTDAVRYDQTLNKFQSYNGSTFDDLVLSPAGGGTGITNWAKASTAEAEAGTADKYPDAAGVLASINANQFDGQGLSLVWSGNSFSQSLSSFGYGWFVVEFQDHIHHVIIHYGGLSSEDSSVAVRNTSSSQTDFYYCSVTSIGAMLGYKRTINGTTHSSAQANMKNIYKVE